VAGIEVARLAGVVTKDDARIVLLLLGVGRTLQCRRLGALQTDTGALTGVHRAGASLNVHVHFHLLSLDGVYVEATEGLRFEPAPAPSHGELVGMLERIHVRVLKWLGRRGLLREADTLSEPPQMSPTEALTSLAMARGTFETVRDNDFEPDGDATEALRTKSDAATHARFNLHAGVWLAAPDDLGRERLCRYLTRPAFALARLRLRRDGNVTYTVKKARRGRVKVRVMTPVECLARLAALVPPPRYPLLRFHGVLAPRHAWRSRVVPRPPATMRTACPPPATDLATPTRPQATPSGDGRALFAPITSVPTPSLTASGDAVRAAPNILSFAHWERLLQGELYAIAPRVDWATLLRRTFDVDVRVCPRCGGRVPVRALVTEPASVRKLLDALSRTRDPPASA